MRLSQGQKALWFLHGLAPEGGAYNIAAALRLTTPVDVDAFERAFQALVDRHPSLRTTFSIEEGEVRQRTGDARFTLEREDTTGWDESRLRARLTEEAFRHVDLERGPLFRVTLFTGDDGEQIALLVVHHIVADFWSFAVMARELPALYRQEVTGEPAGLPPPGLPYEEHVRREREMLEGPRGEAGWRFWRKTLEGLPTLELPTDRPRPAIQTYRGDLRTRRLPTELTAQLKAISRKRGATFFMTLVAAFQTLLMRHTGQEDLAIGSPTAGRQSSSFAGTVGYFVNPVVLRGNLTGDPSFTELLARTRQRVIAAFEHQDYPLPLLAEQLRPQRDPSRTPFFQVSLVLQKEQRGARGLSAFVLGQEGVPIDLGEIHAESVRLDRPPTPFDLQLHVAETPEGLGLGLQLNTDLFDVTTGERLLDRFEVLLRALISDPETGLSALPILGEAERHQLVHGWNDTVGTESESTLWELFAAQTTRTPGAVAVVFEGERLTYAELFRRAAALGSRLAALGVGPEVVVGVRKERSLELVVDLLGVLAAGGAYLPLEPSLPPERLALLLEDARPAVVLSQLAELPAAAGPSPSRASADNAAYVIYTSGSTGRPKGVINRHRGIVNRLLWMRDAFSLNADDRFLQKTPFGFDVSVWEFFMPLVTGARLVVSRPGGHQDPAYLADLVAREGITTIHFVPSMLPVFLAEPGVAAACTTVRRVIVSGEALPFEVEQRCLATLQAPLFNLYGPTEAAVEVTAWRCLPATAPRPVPIGRPIRNARIHLLDPSFGLAPPGAPGELAIGGVPVARGYLGRPDLTAERFVPDPFAPEPGARLYRTGDLARHLGQGEIEFLGRIDHQVKVRGFRIEPQEIELQLASHPGVAEAVVVVRQGAGSLLACIVAESDPPDPASLREHLAARLPAYMVPAGFAFLDRLPRLSNGKVNRRALALLAPVPSAEGGGRAPRTPVEVILASLFSEVLEVDRVGADDGFFDLGGHSLAAMRLAARVREALGIELPVRTIFEASTVAGLAAALADQWKAGIDPAPLIPVPRDAPLPLSFAQQRLWFLDRLEPGSPAYHMPAAVRLTGQLDHRALAAAFCKVVQRHEALRTTLPSVDGEPVQVIGPASDIPLPLIELRNLPAVERAREAERLSASEARRPFDLAKGPLLRTTLLALADDDHLALVNLHHIASDGWSMGMLVREIGPLYSAHSLPDLAVQYPDYSVWQRRLLSGAWLETELSWWRTQLQGLPGALDLPTDHPRKAARTGRGATHAFVLDGETSEALPALSRRQGSTLFMVLLAGFAALLSRLSGQDDLAVGTPIAGRTRVETEPLIGLFVNTLALRIDLTGDPELAELLGRVRETTLAAYTHQEVPFERLVEELAPERDLSRPPLVQAMLVLQNAPAGPLVLPGLTISTTQVDTGTAKLDLTLTLTETEQGLAGALEYNLDLFEPATAARLVARLQRLFAGIVADPRQRVSELPLLSPDERQQILVTWNDVGLLPESDCALHQLFEAQVARTPDGTALIDGRTDERWTYAELDARANALARRLVHSRVGPEVRVGVCLSRTPLLVAALLGVLKAGGVYVPLDPEYPRDRLAFLLEDAGTAVLMTEPELIGRLPATTAELVMVDPEPHPLAPSPIAPPSNGRGGNALPGNLAYLIYTSGSTGRPKGVAIEHRNAVAFAHWARTVFPDEELAGVLASTSISFDLSVFELFVTLAWGGTVVLAAHALELPRLSAAGEVTLVNTVPSALAELLRTGGVPASVRTINLAGEPLSRALADAIHAALPGVRVLDLYGPSEATTYSTWAPVDPEDRREPSIGQAIAGTRAVLLGRRGELVPAGIVGELFLGGAGLARGYLGRPDLTAERFVPDSTGGRLYGTGDLARWRPDGQLEYLGRIDHQVKIRGFRIELGEIEAALRIHPEIAEAAVVARPDRASLLAAVVSRGTVSGTELRSFLRECLPEHMVPTAWAFLPELPLTANGKVDRKVLARLQPGPETSATMHPRTPAEELIAGIFAEVLSLDCVGIEDDFFARGGHSLLATRVVARVRTVLGVDLPVRSVFEHPTVAGLSRLIDQAAQSLDGGAIERVSRDQPLPLSFAQRRLWFLEQMEPGSPAYNVPVAVHLRGRLDRPALAAALAGIERRHEALRVAFHNVAGEPVQIVADQSPASLPVVDLGGLSKQQRTAEVNRLSAAEARRPFDLASGPVWRATLLAVGPTDHRALVTLHHIVSDGWSLGVLAQEIRAIYAGTPLPELSVQYADFAVWQRRRLSDSFLETELSWWRGALNGIPLAFDLPTDRPRPQILGSRGAVLDLTVDAETTAALTGLARRQGATLFMTLLAGLAALLAKQAGQDRLVIGAPVAGRTRAETEPLIGLFVNTLPLGVDLSGDPEIADLLARVRETTLGAYAHQEVPFERLIEELVSKRDLSRPPLVQTLLVLQNTPAGPLILPGLELETAAVPTGTAKLELTWMLTETAQGLAGTVEYNRDLFDEATVARLAERFLRLLAEASADPRRHLSQLPTLEEIEREQIRTSKRSAVERVLDIFAEVLESSRPGLDDDFLALGGDSLQALQIAERVRETFGVDLPVRALFKRPTARHLASAIDRAARSRGALADPSPDSQLDWWRDALSGVPRATAPVSGPARSTHEFAIDGVAAHRLAGFARQHGATPFMALLAAFASLLSRLTGPRDLVIVVHGLPLRIDLSGDPVFPEILVRVRETVLAALAHREVPFERIAEVLSPEITALLVLRRLPSGLGGTIEHDPALLDASVTARLVESFREILDEIASG